MPSEAAEKGNPSALLRPNPGERVEMDPAPLFEDEKTLRARNSAMAAAGLSEKGGSEGGEMGHGDRMTAGAILRGDAGHSMPMTPFEMKAALVNR